MIEGVGCRLLDRREGLSRGSTSLCSSIEASLAEEVLALFNDERGLDEDLDGLRAGCSPTCDMLSSGVTSVSTTVGKLCLFEELDRVERGRESDVCLRSV